MNNSDTGVIAGTMGAMGIAAVAGVTALGVNDTIDTHKNKQNGVYVSKQTGEQIKISNGKVFNNNGEILKDNQGNPLTPDDVKNSNEFRAKRGIVGESLYNSGRKIAEHSPFNKEFRKEESNYNSESHQNSKTQPQTNDNSTHNNTPFKSDNINGSTHFSKSQEFSNTNSKTFRNLKIS